MQKFKIFLILMLTICILALCAVLPMMIAAVQDHRNETKIGTANMETVALQLSTQNESLTVIEKLTLLKDNDCYNISENDAMHTSAQIMSFLENHIQLYVDAGLFSCFDVVEYFAPALCIGSDKHTHFIVWAICMINSNHQGESMTAVVDDETGIILSVDYQANRDQGEIALEHRGYSMDALWNIYLTQLGITVDALDVEPNIEESENGFLTRYIHTTDASGQELVIGLVIDPYGGFATSFMDV